MKKMNELIVIKGGSFGDDPHRCRSAARYVNTHDHINHAFGFRIVKVKKNNE